MNTQKHLNFFRFLLKCWPLKWSQFPLKSTIVLSEYNITKGNFCDHCKVKRVEVDVWASPPPLFTLLGLCGICCTSAVGGSAGKASRGSWITSQDFIFFSPSDTVCKVAMSIILFKTTSPSCPFRIESLLVCSCAVVHLLTELKDNSCSFMSGEMTCVCALQHGAVMFELI